MFFFKIFWTMEFLLKHASTLCLDYTAYSIFGKRRNNSYRWIHTKYGVPAKTQVFLCILMREARLLGVLEKQHSWKWKSSNRLKFWTNTVPCHVGMVAEAWLQIVVRAERVSTVTLFSMVECYRGNNLHFCVSLVIIHPGILVVYYHF